MKLLCFILVVVLSALHGSAAAPSLDQVQKALAFVETGATGAAPSKSDLMRGRAHEVSRFQILPSVWRQYSKSRHYGDPALSWQVACKILADRQKTFTAATGRDWDAFWLYAMWNAPGRCAAAGYNRGRLSPAVRARAAKFSKVLHAHP